MPNWLRTDEYNESVTSLAMVDYNFNQVFEDIHYWKVGLILLHNSLQGFMVCALKGTAGLEVVSEDTRKKMIAYFEGNTDVYPREFLLRFLDLYDRIQDSKYMSKPFRSRKEITESMKSLNSLRNKFIHYVPEGWSLEVSGLPMIINQSLDVIRYLVLDDSGIYKYSTNEKVMIIDLCITIQEKNDKVFRKYMSQ